MSDHCASIQFNMFMGGDGWLLFIIQRYVETFVTVGTIVAVGIISNPFQ